MSDFVIENGVLTKYTGPGGDVVIPEGVTEIGRFAFEDCKGLTSVAVPEGVTAIGEGAFMRCSSMKSVTIADSVTTFGHWAFDQCHSLSDIVVRPRTEKCELGGEVFFPKYYRYTNLAALTYPKLTLSVIKETETKQRLALGYCSEPEQYEEPWAGEYRRYVKSQRKKLTELAQEKKLTKAVEFLQQMEAPSGKKGQKAKSLSPLAKVELLEKTVREEGPDALRAVIDREGPFEFTARALGYACAFGGLEKTRILLDGDADFTYELSGVFKRKYSVTRPVSNYNDYPLSFWMNLARGPLCRDKQRGISSYLGGGSDAQLLPEQERTQIALYLLERGTPGFDAEELLYYAILWGSFGLADALRDAGVGLSEKRGRLLAEPQQYYWWARIDREELHDAILHTRAADSIEVLTRLQNLLDKQGKKLAFSKNTIETWSSDPLCFDARTLRFMLERTDASRLPMGNDMMERFAAYDMADALSMFAEQGWIKTTAQLDKLIDIASEKKKTQALAWLLDYKNRTVDVAAEQAKREKKLRRQLSESPDSVSAMKKIWGWKTQGDGTLCLTGYKGAEKEVVIPAKIGKDVVTAMEDTFNTRALRLTREKIDARKSVSSVTIPESVTSIGSMTFYGCQSVKIVVIPESVTHIDPLAFVLTHSPNLTIHAPAGSYAERYAKKNKIPFEAI